MTPKDAASILPRKTVECELKVLDEGTGEFEMYALVFGNVDRQGDVIEPGSVTNIDELVKDGWIALNHKGDELPLATISTALQDSHGLKLTGRFHSTPQAQEARTIIRERLERGKGVKTSIGYLVPDDGQHYEREDGQEVRHITKLSVYEASYVNLPANPEAEITSAKSLGTSEPEEPPMSREAKVLERVKQALGLGTKSQYKVDGETMEKCRGLVDKCASCAKNVDDMHKSMKGFIDQHKAASDELMKCMKNFQSGDPQPEAQDDDGNVADKPEKPKKPEDKDDEDGPDAQDNDAPSNEDDEDEKTRKAYRDQLRKRQLSGRRLQVCP